MRVWKDISFASLDPEVQAFDFYAPDEGAPLRGAAIWFYGGGLVSGRRCDNAFLAQPLTERGIALALGSYRVMPGAQYPDFLRDAALSCAAAHRRVKALGDVPVIIGGSSAGAYLSMMMCFDRRWLGEVGMAPEDFDGYFFDAGQPTTHFNVLKYRGEDERAVIIDDTAPLFHVRDARPGKPLTILCADDDMPSRLTQNLLLVETLKRFDYPAGLIEMEVMKGYSHCGYDGDRESDGRYILEKRILNLIRRCSN